MSSPIRRRGGRCRIVLAATALILAAASARADDPWRETYYNPQPAADDLLLPMPCGGAMVFRKVATPGAGWLDDIAVTFGNYDARFDYAESQRYDYVIGGFSEDDDPARRHFYIGKYEVTDLQHAALSGECRRASMRGRLPKTGATWFDAVDFAHRYSAWLLAEAPDALPREAGVPGLVRLPSEAEWAFAARGGIAVTPSEFRAPMFPHPDGLHKYVWFGGSASANGKLQLTGLLQPNPLGVHDIVGNADEIVLDPFRLNKHSRLHGHAGATVIRGGNYLTSQANVRVSARQEMLPFKDGAENRVRTVGFRLAIGAPVLVSQDRLGALQEAWRALPRTGEARAQGDADDPLAMIRALGEDIPDEALKTRLDQIALQVRGSIGELRDSQASAAREALRLGAFLVVKLQDDLKRTAAIRSIYEGRVNAGSSERIIDRARASLAAAKAALNDNYQYYQDTVLNVAEQYAAPLLSAQQNVLSREFATRNIEHLDPLVTLFIRHVDQYRHEQTIRADAWIDEIRR